MTGTRRGAWLLGFGTIVLLTVAGCAVPQPEPAGSTGPSASTAPDGFDDSTPQSVLPLGCADVLPADVESAAVTSVPQTVWADESTTPIGVSKLRFKQAGGLFCQWGGEDGTDGVPDQGIQLWVSPDATDEFTQYTTGYPYPDGDVLVNDTLGDGSVLDCGPADEPTLYCTASILVGDYWIYATMDDQDQLGHDKVVSAATVLLSKVVDAVKGAGAPRPVWAAPAGAFDGEALCQDGAVAATVLQVDAETLKLDTSAPDPLYSWPDSTIGQRAGTSCAWSAGDRTVILTTLPGAEWAFDAMMADGIGPNGPSRTDGTAIDAPGADGAIVACGDGCDSAIQFTGSLVVVGNIDPPEHEAQVATLAVAKQLGDQY